MGVSPSTFPSAAPDHGPDAELLANGRPGGLRGAWDPQLREHLPCPTCALNPETRSVSCTLSTSIVSSRVLDQWQRLRDQTGTRWTFAHEAPAHQSANCSALWVWKGKPCRRSVRLLCDPLSRGGVGTDRMAVLPLWSRKVYPLSWMQVRGRSPLTPG